MADWAQITYLLFVGHPSDRKDEYAKLRLKVDLLAPIDINAAKAAAEEYGQINARLAKSLTPD